VAQLELVERSFEERSAVGAQIRGLLAQFALLQYGASLNGEVEVALMSNEILAQLREIQLRLSSLDLDWAQESVASLRVALQELDTNLQQLRDLPPVEALLRDILNAYPEGIRSRYLTPDGKFVVQARVSQSVFDGGNLAEFDRFVASFSSDYFGMPLAAQRLEEHMKRDFFLSTLLAAVLIVLVLWRSLRGWVRAVLAASPLVLGYIWMLGGMRLFSIDFNFLSITISPLLIGIGVDSGIHILHRTMEERRLSLEGAIERGASATAVAVLVTSLTTMLVFGSLLVARTPGLRMLGASALLGIGFSLLFSLLFLPAALRIEGGKRV
jgi:predicted RND superfamily exporter protein